MSHEHRHQQNLEDLPYFQLNLCFSIFILLVQLIGGIYSGSRALLADTMHVAIHTATEMVVIFVLLTGSKKADKFGSWLITALLFLLVGGMVWGAYERYMNPKEIGASIMLVATIAGLLGNIAQRFIVRGRGLACESAEKYKWCLDTDIYSSLGVLTVPAIIFFNPAWIFVDTLIAFAIAGWIVFKVFKMKQPCH